MVHVFLTADHRGLGEKGSVYSCERDVADKLVRLGRAVWEKSDVPSGEVKQEPAKQVPVKALKKPKKSKDK